MQDRREAGWKGDRQGGGSTREETQLVRLSSEKQKKKVQLLFTPPKDTKTSLRAPVFLCIFLKFLSEKNKVKCKLVFPNKAAVQGGTRCRVADPTGRRLIESAALLLAARHQSDPPPGSDLSQVRQVEERQGSGLR